MLRFHLVQRKVGSHPDLGPDLSDAVARGPGNWAICGRFWRKWDVASTVELRKNESREMFSHAESQNFLDHFFGFCKGMALWQIAIWGFNPDTGSNLRYCCAILGACWFWRYRRSTASHGAMPVTHFFGAVIRIVLLGVLSIIGLVLGNILSGKKNLFSWENRWFPAIFSNKTNPMILYTNLSSFKPFEWSAQPEPCGATETLWAFPTVVPILALLPWTFPFQWYSTCVSWNVNPRNKTCG